VSDDEAMTLMVQLTELLAELRAETKGIIAEAKDIAESAKATAAQNERVFRIILNGATTQDEKCAEHRRRLDDLERRMEQVEERKGAA
jgi:hypothetical protein